MAAPYSEDLRRKVVQACARGTQSQRAVAELFNVSLSFVESLITAAGAQLIYLPPYSPDWSPIEPCWSKLKTWLRGVKAKTREALDLAMMKAIGRITNSDARGWFTHCDYAFH